MNERIRIFTFTVLIIVSFICIPAVASAGELTEVSAIETEEGESPAADSEGGETIQPTAFRMIDLNMIGNGVYTGYTVSDTGIIFNSGSNNYAYTITGTAKDLRIAFDSGVDTKVTLNNVEVENSGGAALALLSNARVELTLNGENVLKSTNPVAGSNPGLGVFSSAGIVISGSGSLTAVGGAGSAGIGGGYEGKAGEIIIKGAVQIKAWTMPQTTNEPLFYSASGIGGGASASASTIIIEENAQVTAGGGEITSRGTAETEAYSGAGIGGGGGGKSGDISIRGNANVNAAGGAVSVISDEDIARVGGGAGIGSGARGICGQIMISETVLVEAKGGALYAKSDLEETYSYGGAGIGGGGRGGSCETISINIQGNKNTVSLQADGSRIDAASLEGIVYIYGGTGIGGGGMAGNGGEIRITGDFRGTIKASEQSYQAEEVWNKSGAGIGGGYGSSYHSIYIEDASLTIQGGRYSAGIGAGSHSREDFTGDETIQITGDAVVHTTGGVYGCGIGGGSYIDGQSATSTPGGHIIIDGNTRVTAVSGNRGTGIGGGSGGYNGGYEIVEGSDGGIIEIGGNAQVEAIGRGGAAIGGGGAFCILNAPQSASVELYAGDGGNIIIRDAAKVTAVNEAHGAGIGGGGAYSLSGHTPKAAVVGGGGGEVQIRNQAEVTVTGGSEGYSQAAASAGIGRGSGGGLTMRTGTKLQIDKDAVVIAYSFGTDQPALDMSAFGGSAYFVNAGLSSGRVADEAADIELYQSPWGPGASLDSLTLPGGYLSFAYTTGGQVQENNLSVYVKTDYRGFIVNDGIANQDTIEIRSSQTELYQLVKLAAGRLTVTKEIDNKAKTAESFVFWIEYKEKSDGAVLKQYYGVVSIEPGKSSGSIDFSGLKPGIYTVMETDSNWNYQLDPGQNPTAIQQVSLALGDPSLIHEKVLYHNNEIGNSWISGKSRTDNTLTENSNRLLHIMCSSLFDPI